jgi:Fe2+ or Zn2+ uptake regulation protein/O6-methylguanine-DNA--protein-cysteine methyltransferase
MSQEDPGELLRRHGLRSTPQRRAILQAFRGASDEHLAAEEVLARASIAVPDLGRGTVYATLAELTEVGVLGSVGSSEPVRYETNLASHDHFQCRQCLRLFDVELGGGSLRRRRLTGFRIDSIAVRAEGICGECHDYQLGVQEGAAFAIERPTLSAADLERLTCLRADSPVGALGLAASADGIVRIAFEDHADYTAIAARAQSRRGSHGGRTRCSDLRATLGRYFGGDRQAPIDLIDWTRSGLLNSAVLQAVQRIPFAGTLSYDRLGADVPARERGRLMGGNAIALLIPCHRVTCGSLRLEDYVGGATRLRALQTLEVA